jgi:hypothetical protein
MLEPRLTRMTRKRQIEESEVTGETPKATKKAAVAASNQATARTRSTARSGSTVTKKVVTAHAKKLATANVKNKTTKEPSNKSAQNHPTEKSLRLRNPQGFKPLTTNGQQRHMQIVDAIAAYDARARKDDELSGHMHVRNAQFLGLTKFKKTGTVNMKNLSVQLTCQDCLQKLYMKKEEEPGIILHQEKTKPGKEPVACRTYFICLHCTLFHHPGGTYAVCEHCYHSHSKRPTKYDNNDSGQFQSYDHVELSPRK